MAAFRNISLGLLHRCLPVTMLLCCAAAPNDAATRSQRAVATDQKAVNDASTAVDAATKALTTATEKRSHDFEHSADFKDAQKAVADRLAIAEAARAAALKSLHDSPAWQEASAKRAAAAARANAFRDRPKTAEGTDAQREVDRLDAVINALEDSAIQSDPDYKAAREALMAATAALKGVHDKFTAGAASDPDLTRLRQAKDAAQQKLTQAQTKLELDRARAEAASLLGE